MSLPGRDLYAPPRILPVFVLDSPSARVESGDHLLALVKKNSGKNCLTTGGQRRLNRRKEIEKHRRDDVRENDSYGCKEGQERFRISLKDFHAIGDIIRANVLLRI